MLQCSISGIPTNNKAFDLFILVFWLDSSKSVLLFGLIVSKLSFYYTQTHRRQRHRDRERDRDNCTSLSVRYLNLNFLVYLQYIVAWGPFVRELDKDRDNDRGRSRGRDRQRDRQIDRQTQTRAKEGCLQYHKNTERVLCSVLFGLVRGVRKRPESGENGHQRGSNMADNILNDFVQDKNMTTSLEISNSMAEYLYHFRNVDSEEVLTQFRLQRQLCGLQSLVAAERKHNGAGIPCCFSNLGH